MTNGSSSEEADPLQIFEAWLSKCGSAEEVEFELLLREHPAQRAELLEWELAFRRLLEAGRPPSSSVIERLSRRYGAESVPEVTLPGDEDAGQVRDATSKVTDKISLPGTRFDRYRIRGEVGSGGMGVVLRIWDSELRRHLAMKLILGQAEPRASGTTPPVSSAHVARFLEEAQVTGQLDHPGIVPVHELGLDPKGRLYFTMKLVRGENLHTIFAHLREGRESWTRTRALNVLLRVCEAMAYAHDREVVHRDLKPANVMVGKFGEVHVMDWGLARVRGQPERKDLRPRVPTEEELADEPEAPLRTIDGDVLGTPNYMPPEQAEGRVAEIGPHSDVYALGAMLYHLLVGHEPYFEGGRRLDSRAVLARLKQGAPPPVELLAPGAPAELVAICERAMQRDWKRRYRDMSELAADLSAYLDGRVVSAHESGAWAEARKWILRNKSLAAALAAGLVVLVAGVIVSTILGRRASEQAAVAMHEKQDVLKLRAFRTLAELERRADDLWPARVERSAAYQQWIEDARRLTAQLPDLRATLAEIEARALPQSPEEREAERASHPRLHELESLRAQALYTERLLGRAPWPKQEEVEAQLAREDLPKDAKGLMDMASKLMDAPTTVLGEEVRALLLSQRALLLASGLDRVRAHANLAEALLRLGRYDEVLPEWERAAEVLPPGKHALLDPYRSTLTGYIALWRDADGRVPPAQLQEAVRLEKQVRELEAEVSRRHAWRFPDSDGGNGSGDEYWHEQLQTLIRELEEFADPESGVIEGLSPKHGPGIARRLELATTVEHARSGEEERKRWSEAIAAIEHSPAYRGVDWPGGAGLKPQSGLVPLGLDPDSGLWEFADVQTGVPPVRDGEGRLVLTEDMSVVFVLLPGGQFWMGAQRTDPNAPNYDPDAQRDEGPVHRPMLSPFFLSKFEMTQGQWLRIAGNNPSQFGPGGQFFGKPNDLLHPVERVTWFDCVEYCRRLGFLLPTEAQWEYACRGGTDTPWWTGRDLASLNGKVNLADQAAKHVEMKWVDQELWPDLEDGWALHAPVGTYPANEFGLHEMAGNVWELCGDEMEPYTIPNPVDPFQARQGPGRDIAGRGGGFKNLPKSLRSAARDRNPAENKDFDIGLRPARKLED